MRKNAKKLELAELELQWSVFENMFIARGCLLIYEHHGYA